MTAITKAAVRILEGIFPHPNTGCKHKGILSGVSLADWARAAGVTPVYLGKLMNDHAPRTSYDIVRRLGEAGGLSVEQVWVLITRNRDGNRKRAVRERRKKGKMEYA